MSKLTLRPKLIVVGIFIITNLLFFFKSLQINLLMGEMMRKKSGLNKNFETVRGVSITGFSIGHLKCNGTEPIISKILKRLLDSFPC